MTTIYKSPLISILNVRNNEIISHPEGDYSKLNEKLKRLENLIKKHQPEEPIVVLYQPPEKLEALEKEKTVEKISAMVGRSFSSVPSHIFTLPIIGNRPPMTQFIKIEDFNDFDTHLFYMDNIVNNITAIVESEYDDHPLCHNKKVKFRKATYIDYRQAFSFWEAEKPFGEYALSKVFFDKLVNDLDKMSLDYKINIDFVTDWEDSYSSFNGPPKSYGIEISVNVEGEDTKVEKVNITKEELELCKKDSVFFDKTLSPLLKELSLNILQKSSIKNTKKI